MCIYDYTPYVGCREDEQHFFLQWMKCNKAAERNNKYCPLDQSVPVEEIRKLSGNVLRCPIHRHIAVFQHEFAFDQEKTGDRAASPPVADGEIAESEAERIAKKVVAKALEEALERVAEKKAKSSASSFMSGPKSPRLDEEEEPYIDFGEELRREARERKSRNASRNASRYTSPLQSPTEPVFRPRTAPGTKTYGGEQEYHQPERRGPPRGASHRRGGSADFPPSQHPLDPEEVERRPPRRKSYQNLRRPKTASAEEEPLPRRAVSSLKSPTRQTFDDDQPEDAQTRLPTRSNAYRNPSAAAPEPEAPELDDAGQALPPSTPRRPSPLRNMSRADEDDTAEDPPPTPSSPRPTSRRGSGGTAGGYKVVDVMSSLHKIDERTTDAETSQDDKGLKRSSSAGRRQGTKTAADGGDRDVLDRLRDERPDPTSSVAVARNRRDRLPPREESQTAEPARRNRSRSVDRQGGGSRSNSVDNTHRRTRSQGSVTCTKPSSRDPSPAGTDKGGPALQPPSRPPSRPGSIRSTTGSTTGGPTRPLPAIPTGGQTHWSDELARRSNSSRRWATPSEPSTSPPASPGGGTSSSVRWNLPLAEPIDSPTLGRHFVPGQGLVQVQAKPDSSGYQSFHPLQQVTQMQDPPVSPTTTTASKSSSFLGFGSGSGSGKQSQSQSQDTSPATSVSVASLAGEPRQQPSQSLSQEETEVTTGIALPKRLIKPPAPLSLPLRSPPYATKYPRPLPDAAYASAPVVSVIGGGVNHNSGSSGGLSSRKSLGKLKQTLSGLWDRDRGDREKGKGKGREVAVA